MELQIIQDRPVGKVSNINKPISDEIKIYDEQMNLVGEVLASFGLSIATGKLRLRIKIFDDKMVERFCCGEGKESK